MGMWLKEGELPSGMKPGDFSRPGYSCIYVRNSRRKDRLAVILQSQSRPRRYGRVFTHVSEGSIQTVTSTAEAQLTEEAAAYPEDGDRFEAIACGAYKLAALSKLPLSFIRDRNFDLSRYFMR